MNGSSIRAEFSFVFLKIDSNLYFLRSVSSTAQGSSFYLMTLESHMCSSILYAVFCVILHLDWSLLQKYSSKLGVVIFKPQAILMIKKLSMPSWNWDVSNSDISFMPSSHCDFIYNEVHYIDNFGVFTLECVNIQTVQDDIWHILVWTRYIDDINGSDDGSFLFSIFSLASVNNSQDVRVWRLTKLTCKIFPGQRHIVISLFDQFLAFEPLSQAAEMNVFHCSCAITSTDQRILIGAFTWETDSTRKNVLARQWLLGDMVCGIDLLYFCNLNQFCFFK